MYSRHLLIFYHYTSSIFWDSNRWIQWCWGRTRGWRWQHRWGHRTQSRIHRFRTVCKQICHSTQWISRKHCLGYSILSAETQRNITSDLDFYGYPTSISRSSNSSIRLLSSLIPSASPRESLISLIVSLLTIAINAQWLDFTFSLWL